MARPMKPLLLVVAAGAALGADRTGHGLAATPNGDGTLRRGWLNLNNQNGHITGTVRATQFFYTVTESTGGSDHFALTATAKDEGQERRVTYDVILTGD